MTRRPVVIALALSVAGLVACDRGAGTVDSGAAAQPTQQARATPRARADTIFVELAEWRVTMSRDTIAAGPVVFRVVNAADSPHEFEVEGGNEEWEGGEIQPGAHVDVKADLERGRYEVYCPLAGPEGAHGTKGMKAHLTVI